MFQPHRDAQLEPQTLNGVVVVVLFNFWPQHRPWVWLHLMQGPGRYLKTVPGLLFAKIMGSGDGGGFGLKPSSTHQGLIFFFDTPQAASAYLNSDDLQQIRSKAQDWWQGLLGVNSCRGSWGSQRWTSEGLLDEHDSSPASPPIHHVASLTRGSVRASKAMSFWRFAPAAQADLAQAPGCVLSMGLGEAPVLRQCTFSVWKDTESIVNYAHQGAHLKAIAAAQKHGFFTESMFVRMQVLHMRGSWAGRAFDANAPVAHALGLAT